MMEPLERQAQLQAMMQEQQPPAPQSPLTSGSVAAMDNIKRLLANDPYQSKRAFGAALQNFGASMANPAAHKGGTFGAIAQSLSPALTAYQQANELGQSENMQALEVMNALENQVEEKRRHAEDEKHRAAQLEETRRYHDLMSGGNDNSKFLKLQEEDVIPRDAIPLSSMPANVQNAAFKEAMNDIRQGDEAKNMLITLKEIKKFSDDYPDMNKDMNRLLYARSLNPKATIREVLGNVVGNQEKQNALDIMDKLTNRLVLSEIRSLGGKGATDMAKDIILKGKPHFGLGKGALDYFVDHMSNEISPRYEHGKGQRNAMVNGGFIPMKIHELKSDEDVSSNMVTSPQHASSENSDKLISQQNGAALSDITQPVVTKEAAAQALRQRGIPEKKIPLILQQGGY